MTPNEYQDAATRTIPDNQLVINRRFCFPIPELVHAQLGMTTELGEFSDTLKKHLIYGQPLDIENLEEELGDGLWYYMLAITSIGGKLESIMKANLDKLKIRYPNKFTEENATRRLDKEV